METGTYQDVKSEILAALTRYFRTRIEVEERALRALAVHRRIAVPASPMPAHVWRALECEFPLVTELYSRIGLPSDTTSLSPFPRIKKRRITPQKLDKGEFIWDQTFLSLFGHHNDLTMAGKAVQENGLLRCADLVLTMLQPKNRTSSNPEHRWIGLHNTVLRAFTRAISKSNEEVNITHIAETAQRSWLELCHFDLSSGYQQFVLWNDGKRIHVAPFGVFGGFQMTDENLQEGSIWVARGNVIQPVENEFECKCKEFELVLNASPTEHRLQEFLENNPEFLLSLGPYCTVYPQLILHHEDEGRLIPDFFLERIDSNFCDICDLKRPIRDLVRYQKNRMRFRDAVMEGVAQLDNYRNWFEDKHNREAFRERYGLSAYRPEVVLVIGRRDSYYDDIDRIKLESNLPRWVRLVTYDDMLSRARNWRSMTSQWLAYRDKDVSIGA